jgi:hypothetical protein
MSRYNRRVMPVAHFILYITAAITLIFLSPGGLRNQQAQAQVRPQGPPIESRQRDLRGLRKETPPSRDSDAPLAYPKIEEDLELLQVTNSRLSEAAGSVPALDYRQIRKYAAEVKKRAARIRIHLLLPEPEKSEKVKKRDEEYTPEDLKWEINTLDVLVKRLIENPVFRQPLVFNVDQAAKGWRDLDEIIRLSEQIQKRAEAFSKAATKKP